VANRNRIDVHHHLLPQFYIDAQKSAGRTGTAYGAFPAWSPERALALMDRMQIATAMLSFTAPGIWFGDAPQTGELARRCNDYLAELVATHPRRFGAFAMLPFPDVDASLREIERALDVLKLDGITHLTQVADRYVGHADYLPVYAELDRRKAVVFVHPTYPPKSAEKDWFVPRSIIDYPLETTRAISYMLFTGTLERLPNIKFIMSHAGGAIPFLAHRLALFDALTPYIERYPNGARHYLKRLYYDTTLSTDPAQLSALQALVGPTQILFGSDFPYVSEAIVLAEGERLDGYRGFDARSRPMMECTNAEALFPRFAAR
jgi:predicted TIM-barrel fold metal-dependent hydrolase